EEIAGLREQGERLLTLDVSETATAHFLVAESFEPFAIARAGGARVPNEAELAKAESKATRALKMADHLDDAKLRSAALDGLGSVLSLRGDHRGAREVARQRIAMGSVLDL